MQAGPRGRTYRWLNAHAAHQSELGLVLRLRLRQFVSHARGGNYPLLVVVGMLFFLPLVMLIIGSLRSAPPGQGGGWTLDGFRVAFSEPGSVKTVISSAIFAISSGVLGTAIGALFAWMVTTTDTPFRRLITPLMAVVLVLPHLFLGLGWAVLGDPQVGVLNQAASAVLPFDPPNLNIFSWPGLIAVMSLKTASVAYFLLLGPFLSIDGSLEESSFLAGSGKLVTLMRIDFPLLLPGLLGALALNLVLVFESFDLATVLGKPAGIDVFSTQIYSYIKEQNPANYSAGAALSVGLLVLVIALVALQVKALGGRSFATILGKQGNRSPWRLGRWRWLLGGLTLLFAIGAMALPFATLILGSLQPYFGVFSGLSFSNYQVVLENPEVRQALWNTFLVAAGSGFIAMLIAGWIGVALRRGRGAVSRGSLRLATWVPLMMPGVVLGLAIVWAVLTVPTLDGLYGTVWILGLALIVAISPFAGRAVDAALAQVPEDLTDAARVSGAGPIRAARDVLLPLGARTFLAGWLICGVVSAGNLAVPILLGAQGNPLLTTVVYRLYFSGDAPQAAAVFVLFMVVLCLLLALATLVWRLKADRTTSVETAR